MCATVVVTRAIALKNAAQSISVVRSSASAAVTAAVISAIARSPRAKTSASAVTYAAICTGHPNAAKLEGRFSVVF